MRNSLFFHILLFSLLTISTTIIVLSSFGLLDLQNIINQYNLISIFLTLLIICTITGIVTAQYTKPVKEITRSIDDPTKTAQLFNRSGFLPTEIQQVLHLLIKFQSQSKSFQSDALAEKKSFNSILENMNDGILITDEEGRSTLINQSTRHIFELGEEDVNGLSLAKVLRNHNVNELWQRCKSTMRQEMISFETTPKKSYIRCIATPLNIETPGNILLLFQDLTRIRQLEIIRRDFVSNVSHELRTPLASLKLIAETLQNSALDDPPATKKFLSKMDYEVDNLTQMVEELLELSRIESGQVPLEKKWIEPLKLINNAGERMAMQAERAGLDFQFSCDKDLPKVYIDLPRLSRVIINLLHNAIKFTPPGGRVITSAYRENDNIIFFVKDSGIGIPPKDLERIFERFYKSDPSRSNRGTGLGLSISKHLVETHGGKIWAESDALTGSTILFSIPISSKI